MACAVVGRTSSVEGVYVLVLGAIDQWFFTFREVAQQREYIVTLVFGAHDDIDAFHPLGQLLGLNLRITAGHDNIGRRMFAHQLVDLLATLGRCLFGHSAGIDHHKVGMLAAPGSNLLKAKLLQSIGQRRGLGEVQATAKRIIGNLFHRQSERIR